MTELEQLKSIRDNAPEGSTHYDGEYLKNIDDDLNSCPSRDDTKDWCIDWGVQDWCHKVNIRSLSDINRIIELLEN